MEIVIYIPFAFERGSQIKMQSKIVNNAQSIVIKHEINPVRKLAFLFSYVLTAATATGVVQWRWGFSRMQIEFAALHPPIKTIKLRILLTKCSIAIASHAFGRFCFGVDVALEQTSLSKSFCEKCIHISSSQLSLSTWTVTTSPNSRPRQRKFQPLVLTGGSSPRCQRIEIVFIRWFWHHFKLTVCGIMTPPSSAPSRLLSVLCLT